MSRTYLLMCMALSAVVGCGGTASLGNPTEPADAGLESATGNDAAPQQEAGPDAKSGKAYVLWQQKGANPATGYQGYSIEIDSEGYSCRRWNEFDLAPHPTGPCEASAEVSAAEASELFKRLAAVDFQKVPHGYTVSPGYACGVTMYYERGDGSAPVSLQYSSSTKLRPELNEVYEYLDLIAYPNPAEFCYEVPAFNGAHLLWQAPGGEAGTGPALEVFGDGVIRYWSQTSTLNPLQATAGWDKADKLTPQKTAELFSLLATVDYSALPHAKPIAECSPSLYLAMPGEAPRTLNYNNAAELQPEMNGVYAWLLDNLATTTPATSLPSQYCVF